MNNLALVLVSSMVLGQQPGTSPKDTSTAAVTLTTEDASTWRNLLNIQAEVQQTLRSLEAIARAGAPKDMAQKADNWSSLELAFARGERADRQQIDTLQVLRTKYKCDGCEIILAPDQKTFVIKSPKKEK